MPRVEANLEAAVGKGLKAWFKETGIWGEYLKLSVLGFRGWPDRLVLWEGGNVLFIEFKQPGEVPRALQNYVHGKLLKMGFQVEVHDDRDIALAAIKAKVESTLGASPRDEADREFERLQTLLAARKGKDQHRP